MSKSKSKSKSKKNNTRKNPRTRRTRRTRRKKGSEKQLDPFSSGIVVSQFLDDSTLHNLVQTSKKNIGLDTTKELKKRKEFVRKKRMERLMNNTEIITMFDFQDITGDYTHEFEDFYYDWKEDRGIDDSNDDYRFDAEQDFIMGYFYKRLHYNTEYIIYCPTLTPNQIITTNIEAFESIIRFCLNEPSAKFYKLYDKYRYSLEGGFRLMEKSKVKSNFMIK